jgi:hypothetical protein
MNSDKTARMQSAARMGTPVADIKWANPHRAVHPSWCDGNKVGVTEDGGREVVSVSIRCTCIKRGVSSQLKMAGQTTFTNRRPLLENNR